MQVEGDDDRNLAPEQDPDTLDISPSGSVVSVETMAP